MRPSVDRNYILELAYRRQTDGLNAQEKKILDDWYNNHPDELLELPENETRNERDILDQIAERSLMRVGEVNRGKSTRKKEYFYKWSAAAIIILSISVAVAIVRQKMHHHDRTDYSMTEIQPGSPHAILVLADGKKVDLLAARRGHIATEDGIAINISGEGRLEYIQPYEPNFPGRKPGKYNVLQTPRGGEFQITLSDGTKVWLNAESSLRFPDHFAGSDRTVSITGEAYFEVAHDRSHPFRVLHHDQQIEVLGTHFNVNAYDDEPSGIVTTLSQGSIRIRTANGDRLLAPGEQSIVTANGIIGVAKADSSAAIAWKNGLLQFKNADLSSIMRQISRWYDIKVQFDGAVSERVFNGGFPRSAPLTTILDILKASNIKFTLTDQQGEKVLVVKPN